MKKILFVGLVACLFSVISCEERNQILSSSLYNASFSGASATFGESNVNGYNIPIKLSAPAQKSATEVTVSVSGNAVSGADYELASTTVTIPAGEFFANLEIDLLDDFEEDGEKQIILEIVEVGNGLKAGIDGTVGNKFTITVADNDCAFNIDEFVGTYEVLLDNATTFVYGVAGELCCLETTLVAGATPGTLIDPDFYGIVSAGFANANNNVSLAIDATNLANITVVLDPSPVLGYTNAAGAARNYRQLAGSPGSLFTCDKKFTVKFEIVDAAGNVRQTSTLTYTKK